MGNPSTTGALKVGNTSQNRPVQKHYVDKLYINDLPNIMRQKMGWKVAPRLMEHWLQGQAYAFSEATKNKYLGCKAIDIPPPQMNNTIVTMQWARQYKQVINGIKDLEREWSSKKGINLLKKRLREGDLNLGTEASAMALDTYSQVNKTKIGGLFDTINDYYGTLGACNLKIALKGRRGQHQGRPVFFVEQQGFYIKDSYDFVNGNEFLGYWSKKSGVASKFTMVMNTLRGTGAGAAPAIGAVPDPVPPEFYDEFLTGGYVPVYNRDFESWRNKHHKGGDFIVFSDVFWQPPPPDSLTIIEL